MAPDYTEGRGKGKGKVGADGMGAAGAAVVGLSCDGNRLTAIPPSPWPKHPPGSARDRMSLAGPPPQGAGAVPAGAAPPPAGSVTSTPLVQLPLAAWPEA